MTRRLLALSLILAAAVTHAAGPHGQTPERVIGLLTLPEVFADGPCAEFLPRDILLMAAPESQVVVAAIRADTNWTFAPEGGCSGLTVNVHRWDPSALPVVNALPTEEYQYEAPAAIVLQQQGRWFRIRLGEDSGWVQTSGQSEYLPLERLLTDRSLNYLTPAWDGMLASEPGASPDIRVPPHPRRRVIGYLEPRLEELRVVLEPGQREDEIRAKYRASEVRRRAGPGGSRILLLETGREVPLFESPSRLAPVHDRVETNFCSRVLETAGQNQVIVTDRQPGWYQVVRDGSWLEAERLWLQDSPVWTFHPIDGAAEQGRLADDAWGHDDYSVNVREYRRVGGMLWFRIDVMSHSICASVEEPTIRVSGWVPAHTASGDTTIWFSSRGC